MTFKYYGYKLSWVQLLYWLNFTGLVSTKSFDTDLSKSRHDQNLSYHGIILLRSLIKISLIDLGLRIWWVCFDHMRQDLLERRMLSYFIEHNMETIEYGFGLMSQLGYATYGVWWSYIWRLNSSLIFKVIITQDQLKYLRDMVWVIPNNIERMILHHGPIW